MRTKTLLAIALVMAATTVSADIFGCDETAPRRATVSAAGASRIIVIGRAGSLKVRGQKGAEVTASGTACASDKALLNELKLTATRNGSEVEVEAVIPERHGFGMWNSSIDFEVSLPSDVPVVIKDGSGSLQVNNVATLDVTDGSGEMEIRDVHGNLKVRDGSGEIRIENVSGDVVIVDGSGSISVRGVQRSVRIAEDGSGSIDVGDVRGDFIVERDGSGGVDYSRVSGKVSIPRDDD